MCPADEEGSRCDAADEGDGGDKRNHEQKRGETPEVGARQDRQGPGIPGVGAKVPGAAVVLDLVQAT